MSDQAEIKEQPNVLPMPGSKLTPEMAAMAISYLDRAMIQGIEAPQLLRVKIALEAIARGNQ